MRAVAKGFNMHGEPVTLEGTDLMARCFQHETDHLDGVLFIDRMDLKQRKLAMKEIREAEWSGLSSPPRSSSPRTPPTGRLCRNLRLVFAGTPDTALPSLRALLDSPRHDVVAVVTRPDAQSGRGRKVHPSPGRRAGRGGGHRDAPAAQGR